MRFLSAALFTGTLVVGLHAQAARPASHAVRSPDGGLVAEVAPRGSGQALQVGGRLLYPRTGSVRLVSPPVWSPDGRGIAVIEEGLGGTLLLVVVPRAGARPFVWPLPELGDGALLRPTWIDARRISIGPSMLAPVVIVSWIETTY